MIQPILQTQSAAEPKRDPRAAHRDHALRAVDRALVGLLLERRDLVRSGADAAVDSGDLSARFSALDGGDLERIEVLLLELSGGAA